LNDLLKSRLRKLGSRQHYDFQCIFELLNCAVHIQKPHYVCKGIVWVRQPDFIVSSSYGPANLSVLYQLCMIFLLRSL